MIMSLCGLPRLLPHASAVALLLLVSGAPSALARPAGDMPPTVAEVEPGDTLEGVLRSFGLEQELLGRVILGFSAEFDPKELQPGNVFSVNWSARAPGEPERITLSLGNGEIIELDLSGAIRADRRELQTNESERAVSLMVTESLIEALEEAHAPEKLGLDLAAALAGLVDFRRDIQGGETVEILYSEEVLAGGETLGAPELRYARIEIGGRTLELAREGGTGSPVRVFEDGEPVRLSAAPVLGARISSVFGRRKHPVYGTVRMHTGVDYAAARGTPVFASAPGKVSFIGTRGGYGRVVEIQHDRETMTRYAHLSGFEGGLLAGQQVEAGDRVGAVGASGLATGPNLHYEVRYDGRAVDPLSEERIAALAVLPSEEPVEHVLPKLRRALADGLRADSGA